MDSIEQKVRIALGNEFGNRARQVLSTHPGDIAAAKTAIEDFVAERLSDMVMSGEADQDFGDEYEEKVKRTIDEEYTPDKLTGGVAARWMRGKQFYADAFEQACEHLEMLGLKMPDGIQGAYSEVLGYAQRMDNVVDAIVRTARAGGAIDSASISAAFRAEYKTAEDYVSSIRDGADSINRLMAKFKVMTIAAGEDEGVERLLYDLGKFMADKQLELLEQTTIPADVQAIYKN